MMLLRFRLATYVQIFAAVLVVAAVVALVFAADRAQREAILIHGGAVLGDRVQAGGDAVRGAVEALREDVLFLSQIPPVGGIMRADTNRGVDPRDGDRREAWVRRMEEIFSAFASAHHDYSRISFVGVADGGKEIARVERRRGEVAVMPEAMLSRWGQGSELRGALGLGRGEVYLGEWDAPAGPERTLRRVLRALVPVFAATGAPFGAVVVEFDASLLFDAIASRLPAEAEAYLTDAQGHYLLHPGLSASGETPLELAFPAVRRLSDLAKGNHLPTQIEEAPSGRRLVTAQRIHFDPRRPERFMLLAYVQQEEAFASELGTGRTGLVMRGLAGALLFGAMIQAALSWLFKPLRRVTEAANAVAEGARDVALPASAGGEVGALSRSFAAMLERVGARERDYQRLNEELEARVDARTKELQLAATVVDSTSEGVVVTDMKARIISVNPAFSEITGFSAEEAIGANPRLLKSDHHDEAFYRDLWQQLARNGRWQGDIWNRRKGGEAYLEYLTINMIRGPDGKPHNYVGVFSDVTESRRKDERIRHLAFHDPLTGLPNRFLFTDRLQHALGVAKREQSRVALMFIDLDRFKAVNDSLGHDVGDLLLKEVANRLRAGLRDVDTVARMGGDEFIALLENVDEPEHCAGIASNLIEALSQPMELAGHTTDVGASIGLAFYPEDGSEALELLKHADTAMYAAKKAGRGGYRFFQASMTEQAARRLRFEVELRQAIEGDELELHYQPKVCLRHGTVRGIEALLRWRHHERGLLLPAEFVPVAEESGLIVELGGWVLAAACRQAAEWQARGIFLPVAIKVSAYQLVHDHLADAIAAATSRYGIEPDRLELELTEGMLMIQPDNTVRLLKRLRELGVSITVDEFGTGYSSLAQLHRLPIDALKIDRSFIMNVERNAGDAQVVRTIVALARGLHLTVVATGVETETQASLLRGSGCDFAQGYLFARPAPAAALDEWLAARVESIDPCDCDAPPRLKAVE